MKKIYVQCVNDNVVRICEKRRNESYATNVKDDFLSQIDGTFSFNNFDLEKQTIDGKLKIKFTNKNGDVILESCDTVLYEYEASSVTSLEGHKVEGKVEDNGISFVIHDDECYYGLGDKTGILNKRGYSYINHNTDNPDPQVDSFKSLYKSIPFVLGYHNNMYYGLFFDNTFKTYFDLGNRSKGFYVNHEKGEFDMYFIYGDVKTIIKEYAKLTGFTPMPQRWTLGNHQSRWGYVDEADMRFVSQSYKDIKIPLECIHFDIDYMEDYKVFTVDNNKYKDFKGFIKELNSQGTKVVTIIDPGVKVLDGYFMYDEGVKNDYFAKRNGKIYVNKVWPGDSVYPNYNNINVRKWWADKIKILLDLGISGVWNDMNEPASFNGPLEDDVMFNRENGLECDHTEIHNVYGHLMCEATFNGYKKYSNKRPFVITRACYAGTHKYATTWTGDNHSIWAHLQMAIPQLCNLGLSGMTFAGTDIGGFSSDCTEELMMRWIEVGSFSVLMRNHSCSGTKLQEPYRFSNKVIDIYRKYVLQRYSLTPYYYDLFYKHQNDGLPLIRSLNIEFPDDEVARNISDSFMVGDNILVSPQVLSGQLSKAVYLPKGVWYNYNCNCNCNLDCNCNCKKYDSNGEYFLVSTKLDECPMFVREGSIIPTWEGCTNLDKLYDTLTLKVFPGKSTYTHFIDDGLTYDYLNGKYSLLEIENNNQEVKVRYTHESDIKYKEIKIELMK